MSAGRGHELLALALMVWASLAGLVYVLLRLARGAPPGRRDRNAGNHFQPR
jgi:hypothetical protein